MAREPAYWLVKNRDGQYWSWATKDTTGRATYMAKPGWGERKYALACIETSAHSIAAEEGGRKVPVYVTVRKVSRGHSWAWACKRMLEGKRVRRASWKDYPDEHLRISAHAYLGTVCIARDKTAEIPVRVYVDLMTSTDWELLNE